MFFFQRSDTINQVVRRLECNVCVFFQYQRVVFDVVLKFVKFKINLFKLLCYQGYFFYLDVLLRVIVIFQAKRFIHVFHAAGWGTRIAIDVLYSLSGRCCTGLT